MTSGTARTSHTRIRISDVEKVLVQTAIDLKEILVIDGIDRLDSPSGFRIRTHDRRFARRDA